jgi:putative endopeptidase
MVIRPGDAHGNDIRAGVWAWRYDARRLDQKTDREEWYMAPQVVNAYYNATFNEIVFPAAILQPPFFDLHADPAVNYGAIGAVIGHEMGHGFDDQGAKSDEHGVLRNWWQPEDVERFGALGKRLAAQYSEFKVSEELNVNGQLTLGENIGDQAGVNVALAAWRMSLKGEPAPVLDGYSGEQRFFLGWAQIWRLLMREELLRDIVLSDPHSPPEFRTVGPLRNNDTWYEAFNIRPGERNYLPPEERVRIW